jgi:hypothetical protein
MRKPPRARASISPTATAADRKGIATKKHKKSRCDPDLWIKGHTGIFCAFLWLFPLFDYRIISQPVGLNFEPLGSFLKVELVTRV